MKIIVSVICIFSACTYDSFCQAVSPDRAELLQAVCSNDPLAVETIIRRGVSPHQPISTNAPLITAFEKAVDYGERSVVDTILQFGGPVDFNSSTYSCLVTTAANKHNATNGMIAALVDAGMNPRAKDEQGATALHWAAINGAYELLPELVAYGIDVDAKDNAGKTPLVWVWEGWQISGTAPLADRQKCVDTLIILGADASQTNGLTWRNGSNEMANKGVQAIGDKSPQPDP